MKSNLVRYVEEFHKLYGVPIAEKPGLISDERYVLRHSLISEELHEFATAANERDIVGIADALGDLLYVVVGAALEYGIPIDEVMDEIQRSNLSKLDENGKAVYRKDGKVMKGPNFSPPNIQGVLENGGKQE